MIPTDKCPFCDRVLVKVSLIDGYAKHCNSCRARTDSGFGEIFRYALEFSNEDEIIYMRLIIEPFRVDYDYENENYSISYRSNDERRELRIPQLDWNLININNFGNKLKKLLPFL